jgi:hypothetical protein
VRITAPRVLIFAASVALAGPALVVANDAKDLGALKEEIELRFPGTKVIVQPAPVPGCTRCSLEMRLLTRTSPAITCSSVR